MGIKIEEKEVKKDFLKKGFKLIGKYENSCKPVLCEKDGYLYYIKRNDILTEKKHKIFSINNIKNLFHNFNNYMKNIDEDIELLDYKVLTKRNRKLIMLKLKCSCGDEYERTIEKFLTQKYKCCRNCFEIKYRGKKRRKGNKYLFDFLEKNGYKILDKTIQYKTNDYIEVEDELGFKGFVKINKIKNGSKMSLFDVRINKKYYVHNVNKYMEIENIYGKCIRLVDNSGYTRQGLEFECSCGNKFITSISSFQNGKTKCDVCSKSSSRYERIFESMLSDLNINYIKEFTFNQCRDILPLPFDFYIKDYDLLVEIDGQGHFYPCHFNQISEEKAINTFNITLEHDKIKNEFCKNNNIKLLRIPYTEFENNNYKNIFLEFISK